MRKSELTKLPKDQLVAAIPALDSLRKELEHRMESLYNDSFGTKSYDNPNWAYCQAHLNGQLSEIKRLLELIKLEGDK
jgi:hypothetical protein